MSGSENQKILLSEYTQPPFWIDTVELDFKLNPKATRVTSKIKFFANEDRSDGPHDLRLDGRDLSLISASINGKILAIDEEVLRDKEGLTIPADLVPQDGFLFEAEVDISPETNTALEGLYLSNGMFCTQCEAQGFRKITYYLDRPDVLAKFKVSIEGDAATTPVLLSNGNQISKSEHDGICKAVWEDPHPKPSYLFALVGGQLNAVSDEFTTSSGRKVDLQIFVRPGDEPKCDYAMDALKRSMAWDEKAYGLEYDLDIFMIVAVDDFNMGAMENKGLNIFNSKYVLASPETATDRDYELIESIIAHEYFHNWTGNRITCRDWFQLSLKEGLTVFRDQQFSSDMRGEDVKRIDDVSQLRARQFKEDAGPLAHPVRPEEYIEINNFYTATVYEKGAEVIRMLRILVGEDGYDNALKLYFDRHDGQACTIEDWLSVFEDACTTDLSQFKRWYRQAGTPVVHVTDAFEDGTYTLTMRQELPDTPNQSNKEPQVIPILTALFDHSGKKLDDDQLLVLDQKSKTFEFNGLETEPFPSLLRGFSAPVTLKHDVTKSEKLFLLAHDDDSFNRWQAGRDLVTKGLLEQYDGQDPDLEVAHILVNLAGDNSLSESYRALLLSTPSQDSLAQKIADIGQTPDPAKIYETLKAWKLCVADCFLDAHSLLLAIPRPTTFKPVAKDAGQRALRSAIMQVISFQDGPQIAQQAFKDATNMTEQLSALSLLISHGADQDETAMFYDQWKDDKLVMDKWFALQVSTCPPDVASDKAKALSKHADFDLKNPNRFRSLIGGLVGNHAGFHHASGQGYEFVGEWLEKLDAINPQTTARMLTCFDAWKRYDKNRQATIKNILKRIQKKPDLSKDSAEILGKILGG